MEADKHIKNGDYVNHYHLSTGSNAIYLIQTEKNKPVFEEHITYDSPEEAEQQFNNL